jgi:hypothetical protein
MGTRYPDLFAALAAPFASHEVKFRSQSGKQLHYITARTVMIRLDNVLGPENWWDEYVPGENSVLCKLTIRLPDNSTLTKSDAGGYAGMADSGDDDKSGYSDAFKRAAVKLGLARYLYRDGVPTFVQERAAPGEPNPGTAHEDYHGTPDTPGGADGSAYRGPSPSSDPPAGGNGRTGGGGYSGQAPRSGKALFAWTKEQEQKYEVGLLKYINNWAKLQEFPGRMVDWQPEQVALAYKEACRKLQSIGEQGQDGYEDALAN